MRAVDCRSPCLRGSEGQRRDLLAGVLDRPARSRRAAASGCLRCPPALPRTCTTSSSGSASSARRPGRPRRRRCRSAPTTTSSGSSASGWRTRSCEVSARTTRSRVIVDVRPVPSVPVRCVEVDNADHLYLAGRSMVPTHNSTLGLDIARSSAIKHNMATCIFSLEMSRNEITMRLLSAEARVPLHHMRTGQLTDDDWTRLARRMGEVVRRAAVHRRLAEHVDDGDPGQVPPAQAAPRPQARHHRLPAADVRAASGSRAASRRSPSSPGRSSCWPRSSRSRSSRSPSSTVAPSSAPTRSRRCPTFASPGRSSRTPTW